MLHANAFLDVSPGQEYWLARCAAHLRRYDVRVASLPASGVVRVWVQMDQNDKRRVPQCIVQGHKLVGEARLNPCRPATESLEQSESGLLQ